MRVFVFAYYSIKDPVFVSATLNYLIEASKLDESLEFYLLTFEHSGFSIPDDEIRLIEQELADTKIYWNRSKWRTAGGLIKPLVKMYDLLMGIWLGKKIVNRNKCEMIFSEGVVGASIAYFISKITGKPHLIHSFEPHADSMKEGKVWNSSSWEYRLLRNFEKRLARTATTLITSTKAYKSVINTWGSVAKTYVIPSCVQTKEFHFFPESRVRIRQEHSIQEDEVVLVYLGKFGGMYMEEELFQFFKNCESAKKLSLRYWIFSGDDTNWICDQFEQHHIPKSKIFVKRLNKGDIPHYLSAADIGVVAVRPLPSKRYCSPIKTGEYWACGLPIIVPIGVGDESDMVKENPRFGLSIEKLQDYHLEKRLTRIDDPILHNTRALDKYIVEWKEALKVTVKESKRPN